MDSVVVRMDDMAKNQVQRAMDKEDRVNMYIAELAAIMKAVDWAAAALLDVVTGLRKATVYSDSMAASGYRRSSTPERTGVDTTR